MFIDDAALLTTTPTVGTTTVQEFQPTPVDLIDSHSPSTQPDMATGREVRVLDNERFPVDGVEIKDVKDFPCLRSVISPTGRLPMDVDVENV